MAHYFHRFARLGIPVLISGKWYKPNLGLGEVLITRIDSLEFGPIDISVRVQNHNEKEGNRGRLMPSAAAASLGLMSAKPGPERGYSVDLCPWCVPRRATARTEMSVMPVYQLLPSAGKTKRVGACVFSLKPTAHESRKK
jgi:hypothetical protein